MHLEVEKNLNLIKGKCLVKIAAQSRVELSSGLLQEKIENV